MYIIERKELDQPECPWEPVEASWECPGHFNERDTAAQIARTLALRHDGHVAFRVVDTQTDQPVVTFWMRKALYQAQVRITGATPPRQRTRLSADTSGARLCWDDVRDAGA